ALADRFYTQLSGGEKQRVQLARILAQLWPAEQQLGLMLLDEPTASLDLAHQCQLLDYCRHWLSPGRAVLLAMHDINLALRYADRILILQQGELVADGEPAQIADAALLRRVFGLTVHIAERPDGSGPWVLW
ncbi:MAG: heme ABC transporter ATP-binding protein, partial [Cellvibrionaceae bacterium]|nr:heme ABC transporter ATP-binding protein [Cellvibrionaceae bacterium]